MAVSSDLRVLVVDDDADTRSNLRDILELDNFQVETAGTAAEVLRRADWEGSRPFSSTAACPTATRRNCCRACGNWPRKQRS